jgi:trigger factor
MEAQMNERLEDAKGRVRINGFRPGKVPFAHLKKMYGKSIMAELVNEIVRDRPSTILSERGEKSATQPEIGMTEDQAEAEKILAGQADFEFTLSYEVIPAIELKDASGIAVTREVVEIDASEVDEQILKIAESARSYETKKGKAADGDRVTIDYLGKVDGEAFDGGKDEDAELVLGSNRFIPGFEEQLVGLKAGDEKVITVTFPADYPAAKPRRQGSHLRHQRQGSRCRRRRRDQRRAGQEARPRIGRQAARNRSWPDRKPVRFGHPPEGQASDPRPARRDVQVRHAGAPGRRRVRKHLAPDQHGPQQSGKTFADEDTTEEAAREEYRKLAERRVRLGLVLSEIGEKAGVQVSDEEMQRSLYEQLRSSRARKSRSSITSRRPQVLAASLRAPIFEEKVVDHLLSEIKVTDKAVSKDELMAEDEEVPRRKPRRPRRRKRLLPRLTKLRKAKRPLRRRRPRPRRRPLKATPSNRFDPIEYGKAAHRAAFLFGCNDSPVNGYGEPILNTLSITCFVQM